ncbi:major facilitator superfamily domain-containing protein [Peziza echinospora]|nr:major facilitator superfamily domain-containing protein [Peziza echinospora]
MGSDTFKKQSLKSKTGQTKAADLTLRQSIVPLMLVTILFFLWGFAYGLLDVLNKHFQVTLNVSRGQSSGLQAAYFGAYPVASLTFAGFVLRRYGYKATFIMGLCLFGVGALLFWPSAKYRSFGGFCGATFVIGCGLGTLESAANPYIAVCGPPKYTEMRLNMSQALQAIGTVVGPVLASQVFFKSVGENDLDSVQWVYLGIAIFVTSLAVVFYFAPIPEISDEDMELLANKMVAKNNENNDNAGIVEAVAEERVQKPIWKNVNLMWAVFSQFCYVAGQVAVAGYFVNYATEVRHGTSNSMGANFLAIAQGCFSLGRFLGVVFMKFFMPRKVFIAFFTCLIIFQCLSIGLTGNAGLAMLNLVLLFESILFPTIFGFGLRGLGIQTKLGSSFLVASVVGGAVGPASLGFTADLFDSTRKAMIIPLIFFVVAYSYPIATNWYPKIRNLIDDFSGKELEQNVSTPQNNDSLSEKGSISYEDKNDVIVSSK